MNYSRLTLYKNIQFPRDYSHVLHFATVAEQKSYFNQASLKYTTFNDFLYIEKTKKIVVNGAKGDLLACNYLSFVNGDNSKVFYAFIDDLIYESDGSTTISYTIDIMQTYMFDYELGNCDVEREHAIRFYLNGRRTNNGIFTTEPQITSNESICEYLTNFNHNRKTSGAGGELGGGEVLYWIIVYRSDYLDSTVRQLNTQMLPTYAFPVTNTGKYGWIDVDRRFVYYEELCRMNDSKIVGAQIVTDIPFKYEYESGNVNSFFVTGLDVVKWGNGYVVDLTYMSRAGGGTTTEKYLGGITGTSFGFNNPITNKNSLFTDEVKANYYKMWTSQFTQIALETSGNIEYLKGELIPTNTSISISLGTTLSNPVLQYLRIQGYKYDNNSSVILANFIKNDYSVPIRADSYLTWFANEGLTSAFDVIGSTISGAFMGGTVGAASGLAVGGVKYLGDSIQAVVKPDSLYNIKSSVPAFKYKEGLNTSVMRITLKEKEPFFNMFQKYGYLTNMSKVPNYDSHYWFNYIKTLNVSLINMKNMSHNIIDEIKQVYNNGVTLWHYNGGDYKWIDYDCNNIERSIAT